MSSHVRFLMHGILGRASKLRGYMMRMGSRESLGRSKYILWGLRGGKRCIGMRESIYLDRGRRSGMMGIGMLDIIRIM